MNDHKGNKNYFQHNRISTKSSWDTDLAHNRECGNSNWLKILQGCTTLPTRREDHAAHPTDHVGQEGTPVNRSQQGSIIEFYT